MSKKDVRVAGLEYELADDRLTPIEYRSDDSLLGFDLIVWDVNAYVQTITDEVIRRRRHDLQDHLRSGRPLVVMVPAPKRVTVTGDLLLQEKTRLSLLPFQLSTRTARGDNFELAAGEPFATLWEQLEQISTYEAIIDPPVGDTLVKIKKSIAVVASLVRVEQSAVLLLPRLSEDFRYDGEKARPDGQFQSHIDLIDHFLDYFDSLESRTELPDWTKLYRLPGESEIVDRISRDRQAIRNAEIRIQRRQAKLLQLQRRKGLVAASGATLEKAVEDAFRGLGCEVEPGPEGGTDRIVRFGNRVAVVEIKGPSKSAAEADSAQLSKWVAQYRADHRRTPKAILVANAWRKRPLQERTQRAFPNQMLRYAVSQQGQCLITGTQLLGAWLAAEANPKRRGSILRKIFLHRGVFPDFADWRAFLDVVADDGV